MMASSSSKRLLLPVMAFLALAVFALPGYAAVNESIIDSPVHGFNTTDTTPEITFRVIGNETPIDVTIFLNDVLRLNLTADNSTAAKFNLTARSDGITRVRVQGIINGSNAMNSTEINITVDTTAPTATYTSASVGSNAQIEADATHTFAVTVTDATLSVDKCVLWYNSVADTTTTSSGGTCSVSKKVIANGNYYFVVNDTLGNSATTSRRYFRAEEAGAVVVPTGAQQTGIIPTAQQQAGRGGIPILDNIMNAFAGIADWFGSLFSGILGR